MNNKRLTVINNNFNKKYPDFDLYIYRNNNNDLMNMNNIQLRLHYDKYGNKEDRIHSFKSLYPDFNIEYYKYFNKDLVGFNENKLKKHYYNNGKNESRIYSLNKFIEYNNLNYKIFLEKYKLFFDMYDKFSNLYKNKEINYLKFYLIFTDKSKISNIGYITENDNKTFNFVLKEFTRIYFDKNYYKENNEDLKNLNEKDLYKHWLECGFCENRICSLKYKNNFDRTLEINIYKINKLCLFITNNLGGGSFKFRDYIKNILNVDIDTIIDIKNKQELNNFINNYDILKIQYKCIVLNNYLFTDLDNEFIFEIKRKYNFKLIIPIHEWYWFVYPYIRCFDENSDILNNFYLNDKLEHKENLQFPENTLNLFKQAKIICPSLFVYTKFKKNLNNEYEIIYKEWINNFTYKINHKLKLKFKNKINLGMLVMPSDCKGIEIVKYLEENIKYYKNMKINYYIVNENIEMYDDNLESFYILLKKYNIHGLFLLNKYGETYCFSLNKYLYSNLPIFYNNVGSFKERIPKDHINYIINNDFEYDYYNYSKLKDNFNYFLNNLMFTKYVNIYNIYVIISSNYENILLNVKKYKNENVKIILLCNYDILDLEKQQIIKFIDLFLYRETITTKYNLLNEKEYVSLISNLLKQYDIKYNNLQYIFC